MDDLLSRKHAHQAFSIASEAFEVTVCRRWAVGGVLAIRLKMPVDTIWLLISLLQFYDVNQILY
jgi:hypothetical protein